MKYFENIIQKKPVDIIIAALFTGAALQFGYIALGLWPAVIFTFGYFGGLVLWLINPIEATFKRIRLSYGLTLALFVVHKIEERKSDFFPALSELTGVPMPEAGSIKAIVLYAIAGLWLLIPFLISKKISLGYYLAWTFFASMGISELAHFVFPLFRNQPYTYFPGMWSVIILAPTSWWGMYTLKKVIQFPKSNKIID